MIEEGNERYVNEALPLLTVVEGTDPGLVPEILWRHVASRIPYDNPRAPRTDASPLHIAEIAYYDRQVAAALLEPVLARLEQTEPNELARWGYEFLAWSHIDPRAAVARLEKIPVAQDTEIYHGSNSARFIVGRSLARTREQRWRISHDVREFIFGGKRGF
jgi:hypothetical protein